ncbi:MAG: hypothetical protein E7015_03155 [Alphaproteobacteria bacterium]|nr:hypothetical protein [Alphaproteobacteria bacterium]
MFKVSNNRKNQLLAWFFFCLVFLNDNFCVAMKPECISNECWNGYTKTWVNSRSVIPETDDIHERMAYRVELAVSKDIIELKHSNVASFAMSIKYEDGSFVNLLLPFVVASCEVNGEENSFAYYWRYDKKYMPLISVSLLRKSRGLWFL